MADIADSGAGVEYRHSRSLHGDEEIGKPKRVSREIKIDHAAVKARIQKQLEATGSTTVEEVLLHLLETREEQDRWLFENRAAMNAKIRRGRRGRMTAS